MLDQSAFACSPTFVRSLRTLDPGAGMFSLPRASPTYGRAHFLISESQALPTTFRAHRYSVPMSDNPLRTCPSVEGFSCPGGQIPGAALFDRFSFLKNQCFLVDFRPRNIALWWSANSLRALTPPTQRNSNALPPCLRNEIKLHYRPTMESHDASPLCATTQGRPSLR